LLVIHFLRQFKHLQKKQSDDVVNHMIEHVYMDDDMPMILGEKEVKNKLFEAAYEIRDILSKYTTVTLETVYILRRMGIHGVDYVAAGDTSDVQDQSYGYYVRGGLYKSYYIL